MKESRYGEIGTAVGLTTGASILLGLLAAIAIRMIFAAFGEEPTLANLLIAYTIGSVSYYFAAPVNLMYILGYKTRKSDFSYILKWTMLTMGLFIVGSCLGVGFIFFESLTSQSATPLSASYQYISGLSLTCICTGIHWLAFRWKKNPETGMTGQPHKG